MKSYTDIEQSKKLAEFLPNESADMFFWKRTIKKDDYAISVGHSKELQEGFTSKEIEYIPCWSLAALLWYLKTLKPLVYLPMLFANDEIWILQFVERGHGNVAEITSDNPIDACYEMILELYRRKLL